MIDLWSTSRNVLVQITGNVKQTEKFLFNYKYL